jgi:cellulose biosynthesis protein BcsQ
MLIASLNFKGGQGKSMWAAILATWLGDQVEILDLDYRQGDSLAWAQRAGRPSRLVRPNDYEQILRTAAASDEWFVVDCPPGEEAQTDLVLRLAALLVIPVLPAGIQDASAWGRMREAIKDAQVTNPGLKIASILNGARRTTMSTQFLAMLKEWHAPKEGRAFIGSVPQRVAFADSYGAGKAPHDPSIDDVLAMLERFASA